jgi:hypothetical protein
MDDTAAHSRTRFNPLNFTDDITLPLVPRQNIEWRRRPETAAPKHG